MLDNEPNATIDLGVEDTSSGESNVTFENDTSSDQPLTPVETSGEVKGLTGFKQRIEKKMKSLDEEAKSGKTPEGDNSKPAPQAKSGAQAPVIPPAGTAIVPPAYTPNFKFKYFDSKQHKQVEAEFDEWAKSAIKDPESEKKIREMYEKSMGFDSVKSHRDRFKFESEKTQTEIRETKEALNVLSQYVAEGDMESFFESLKIPEGKVLSYALRRLQYRELPPERKREYDEARNAKKRAEILEVQNRDLSQQYQTTAVETRSQQLDSILGGPQVSGVVESFNARMGDPDAFKREVIKRGAMHWHLYKQDLPAEQLVQEVIQVLGNPAPQGPQNSQTMPQQGYEQPQAQQANGFAQAPQVLAPQPKPIIPNIQGKGSSPAKKVVRSIADLKQRARAAE